MLQKATNFGETGEEGKMHRYIDCIKDSVKKTVRNSLCRRPKS
jgi:hypothetical protein